MIININPDLDGEIFAAFIFGILTGLDRMADYFYFLIDDIINLDFGTIEYFIIGKFRKSFHNNPCKGFFIFCFLEICFIIQNNLLSKYLLRRLRVLAYFSQPQ